MGLCPTLCYTSFLGQDLLLVQLIWVLPNVALPFISMEKKRPFCINNQVITLLILWDLRVKIDDQHCNWGKTHVKKMWAIQALNVSLLKPGQNPGEFIPILIHHYQTDGTVRVKIMIFYLFLIFLVTLLLNCRPWYWELRICLEKIFGNSEETSTQGQTWFFRSINKNIFDPGSNYPLTTILYEKDEEEVGSSYKMGIINFIILTKDLNNKLGSCCSWNYIRKADWWIRRNHLWFKQGSVFYATSLFLGVTRRGIS